MITTATRDQVVSARDSAFAGYGVGSDTGAYYAVIGAVPGAGDSVYARSPRTGMVVRVTRTGTANVRGRGEQVRVRIAFAQDSGDAAGTLVFDSAVGVGGVAPRAVFTA